MDHRKPKEREKKKVFSVHITMLNREKGWAGLFYTVPRKSCLSIAPELD